MRRVIAPFGALIAFAALASGCGYSLKTSDNPLATKENIRKIFIQPLKNDTFTVGVEHIVYNALVKNIDAQGQLILVRTEQEADAVLSGTVSTASSRHNAATGSASPSSLRGFAPPALTSEYVANLGCSLTLTRTLTNPAPAGHATTVWSAGFSRSAPYPAAVRLGVQGTTSALINDSEFTRALRQMAELIGRDASESMTSVF